MVKVFSINNNIFSNSCISDVNTHKKNNITSLKLSSDDVFKYLGKNISFSGVRNHFASNSFEDVKELFEQYEIINGKKEYINIVDFISNGKRSELAKNISILGATFDYCQPFKLRTPQTTVGKHLTEVVGHLYYHNEEFKTLSDEDKKLLLKVAVFHDIGKTENKLYKYQLDKPYFTDMIRQRIKKFEIFNEPSEYIKNIRAYFDRNPNEDNMILHNNIHHKISVELLNRYIKTNPKDKEEFEKIKSLVLNHQVFGELIDKYNNNLISKDEFYNLAEQFAQDVNDRHMLKLIMTFHLSDAAAVYANKPEYYKLFKIQLAEIYNKALSSLSE